MRYNGQFLHHTSKLCFVTMKLEKKTKSKKFTTKKQTIK